MSPVDAMAALRRRGWPSLASCKAAVDAVGPDIEKAEAWLRTHEQVPGAGRIRHRLRVDAAPCAGVVGEAREELRPRIVDGFLRVTPPDFLRRRPGRGGDGGMP